MTEQTESLLERAMALRARCLTRKRELSGRWFGSSDLVLFDEAEHVIGKLIESLAGTQEKLGVSEVNRGELETRSKELSMERDLWRELAQDAVRDANTGRQQIIEALQEDYRCEACCYLAAECQCEPETKGDQDGDSDD